MFGGRGGRSQGNVFALRLECVERSDDFFLHLRGYKNVPVAGIQVGRQLPLDAALRTFVFICEGSINRIEVLEDQRRVSAGCQRQWLGQRVLVYNAQIPQRNGPSLLSSIDGVAPLLLIHIGAFQEGDRAVACDAAVASIPFIWVSGGQCHHADLGPVNFLGSLALVLRDAPALPKGTGWQDPCHFTDDPLRVVEHGPLIVGLGIFLAIFVGG
mmetsp:Transcript_55182/g.131502  ORF Transcript_55182/g.131502 Transcript_55182/m.131502 type:complete len:213 (-) Transcript_55182:1644-2282(-)